MDIKLMNRKSRWIYGLIIALLVISVIWIIPAYKRNRAEKEGKRLFLTPVCQKIYGISINLSKALEKAEWLNAGMGGATAYLNELADVFCGGFSCGYPGYADETNLEMSAAVAHVQEELMSVYSKQTDGIPLTDEDYYFLRELEVAFNDLCNSLSNDDGSINKKAFNDKYVAEVFRDFKYAVIILKAP